MSVRETTRQAADTPISAEATELVYELLDAHYDTAELAAELPTRDWRWQVHLEYLQALQHKVREMLARGSASAAA